MNNFTPELKQKIRQLLTECGQEAKQLGSKEFQIYEKGPDDYVTSVDRLLDQQLSEGFATLFPGDGIITEENERSKQMFYTDNRRLWCIDPLDGTDDFIKGKPHYAVMVGLLLDNYPVAGWIYAPSQKQIYYGGPEWGLFQATDNETPQELLPKEPPNPSESFCPMMLGQKDMLKFGDAILQNIPGAEFYCLGSFGLKVIEVIKGNVGIYLYLNGRVKLWDTTGPIALAKAAGLTCCDLNGEPISFHADVINPDTLAHTQSIVIGWPKYVEALRSQLQKAVEATI